MASCTGRIQNFPRLLVGGQVKPHHTSKLGRVYKADCAGPESKVVPQERMFAVPASLRLHLYVLFGSNRGGCETLASRFVSQASQRGAQTFFSDLDSFDDWSGASRPQTALIIVCSTYNGLPPQNAVEFMKRLEARKVLPRLKFAVFGVGNSLWTSTFMRVSTKIDSRLAELGGSRLVDPGVADEEDERIEHPFRRWSDRLWDAIRREFIVPQELRKLVDADSSPQSITCDAAKFVATYTHEFADEQPADEQPGRVRPPLPVPQCRRRRLNHCLLYHPQPTTGCRPRHMPRQASTNSSTLALSRATVSFTPPHPTGRCG